MLINFVCTAFKSTGPAEFFRNYEFKKTCQAKAVGHETRYFLVSFN